MPTDALAPIADSARFEILERTGLKGQDLARARRFILTGQGTAWQDRSRALTLSKNAGITWIRQQVRWRDLHDASGAIYCFRAANVLIIVGDEVSRPQLVALTDAVLAIEDR